MRRCDVHFLQAGYCRHPEAMTLRGGALTSAVFPSLVGLLIHPSEGAVLFDTGYDKAFIEATRPFPQRLYRWLTPPTISAETSVASQLGRFGLTPDDVRWVVLSHFHGDHIAGLHTFGRARIACSRRGLYAARTGGGVRALTGGVLRALIPPDIDARVVFFEDRPAGPLPGAFRPFEVGADLLGDGSLLAVELPGHCPGHWGLVARGQDDGLHFLTADASWSSLAIRENRPPPRITTAFLGRTMPYRHTLARLHRMVCDAPELTITPSHCAERAAQIALAGGATDDRNA
jgi:glyoxylase-like metal-dependent hydrolase (beta-lactamase superfamily II)